MSDRSVSHITDDERRRYTLEELTLSPAERERFELRGALMAAIHEGLDGAITGQVSDRGVERCADHILSEWVPRLLVGGVSAGYAGTPGAQVDPVQTTVHADTSVTITDGEPNAVTERWVTADPDEVCRHAGDGHRYARWGQCVISYDEERELIPAVYSSGWGGGEVEFGADTTWRLSLDEAEAFVARLQHAIAYERARGGGSDG